ncbi:MAG: baseplate J/gp47 family protein [Selenomonadaceae bacterium]|nr:baseplate J/gp47 family protein [Selenomonadaceae bacterium]
MLKNLPKINFVEADPTTLDSEIVSTVENYLGRKLASADPLRLFLKALEAIIIHQRLLIDWTAKQNLLAFSEDEYLEHLGALVGVERLPASKAITTVQVELSAVRQQTTVIRAGTRVTADSKIFFALDSDVVFLAGETKKTCAATCTVEGEAGNNYAIGELNKIVDNQPWLKSIVNITKSEGGANTESDDALRERIHSAPESFSCAGSIGAYRFHALSASSLISDVFVTSPSPGVVAVYPLLQNGELPSTEILNLVKNKLNSNKVRPLTDTVNVLAPTKLNYSIDATYYISQEDSSQAAQIIAAVETAKQDYIDWQRAKLSRDLNPTELIFRLKQAGAHRVEVRSPVYTIVSDATVAVPSSVNVVFGGLEND